MFVFNIIILLYEFVRIPVLQSIDNILVFVKDVVEDICQVH